MDNGFYILKEMEMDNRAAGKKRTKMNAANFLQLHPDTRMEIAAVAPSHFGNSSCYKNIAPIQNKKN